MPIRPSQRECKTEQFATSNDGTPVKTDVEGKLRNTHFGPTKALVPLFEAVVNSFQAIEDVGNGASRRPHRVEITANRDAPIAGIVSRIDGFTVTDDGIGFTDENLDAFFTAETRYKAKRGGKGLGRFSWLKLFLYAQVESHFRQDGKMWMRSFKFRAQEEPPAPLTESIEPEPKTSITLFGMMTPWKENCPRSLETIGHRLIEHCLPFFLDPKCPAVIIRDDADHIDLNEYFKEHFEAKATQHSFRVGDIGFTLKGMRLHTPQERHHRLLYAANSREVVHDRLESYLPNLRKTLTDEGGAFVYMGFVESTFLDAPGSVNTERTNFTFPSDQTSEDSDSNEITLASIRNAALPAVTADLAPFLAEINAEKQDAIETYIETEAPQFRPLKRYLRDFIDRIPPGAGGKALETALHEQLYEKQQQIRNESRALLEESDKASLKPEEYEAKLNDFLERSNELGKSSLAEYVVHRRVMLEFLEKSLQLNPDTGKYPLEEIVHKIIYPMKTTSDDVPYEQQNLWIIDERLSFHGFLGSDMPLNSMAPLGSAYKSRPDLFIFDRALSFSEESTALTSLVIVEFKKPARTDYSKEDPVAQVTRLISEIKGGHFKDKNGVEIKAQSERLPTYAYIICDTTKEIVAIAESRGMLPTPDNLGYYIYNPPLSAYIEIISYAKLLRDAKRRNRVLFEKLQLPVN
jgi:hypothetical protein